MGLPGISPLQAASSSRFLSNWGGGGTELGGSLMFLPAVESLARLPLGWPREHYLVSILAFQQHPPPRPL